MKIIGILLATIFISSCTSFDPAIPEGYTGDTATLMDSYSNHTGSKAHFFVLTHIDERPVEDSSARTRMNNAGYGFRLNTHMVTREITTAEQVFTVSGFVYYATDFQAMFGNSMRVTKQITFKPIAGEVYSVRGTLSEDGPDLWIQDYEGNKFTGDFIDK